MKVAIAFGRHFHFFYTFPDTRHHASERNLIFIGRKNIFPREKKSDSRRQAEKPE
jgi:hypothetical protein